MKFDNLGTMNDWHLSYFVFGAVLAACWAPPATAQEPVGPPCQTAQVIDPNDEDSETFGAGRFGGAFMVASELAEDTVDIFRFTGTEWTVHTTLSPDAPPDEPTQFGFIAMDAHVLAVGDDQPYGNGSVAIYRFENGAWNFEQQIFAQDVEAPQAEVFGRHLALDNDVLVVGNTNSGIVKPLVDGTVFVFRYSGNQWILETVISGPEQAATNSFGKSVAVSGDWLVVSDTAADGPVDVTGVVFIYRHENGKWTLEQILEPPDGGTTGMGFGRATDLDKTGDSLVLGAPDDLAQLGSVYVYQHNGEQWAFEQKLTASESFGSFAFLGNDVAINETADTILAGAPNDWEVSFEAGAAHVFRYDGEQWYEAAKLLPDDDGGELFGGGVDLDIDRGAVSRGDAPLAYVRIYTGMRGLDCNGNGEPDACDIHNGTSFDSNHNGVPNECDGVPDFDGNEIIDVDDLVFLLKVWGTGDADTNQDGVTNVTDLLNVLEQWGPVNDPPDCSSNADCCTIHAPGGCADESCCMTVCEQDAFCCATAWDTLCVDAAQRLCDVCD